jgi:hypothetical protein
MFTAATNRRVRSAIKQPKDVIVMARTISLRLAVLATTIVGMVLVAAGQSAAMIPPPDPGGSSSDGGRIPTPAQPVTDNSDWTLQWVLFAGAVVGALAIVAVVSGALGRRRWPRPPLEAALGGPDELPRAAGLLGDLFVQHNRAGAAEHAYRAAIDVGDEYWSPIAQVALAQLMRDRGHREEAQALLETAIASGNPRTASVAQTALSELSTGRATHPAIGRPLEDYETLSGPAAAHRSRAASADPPW